MVLNTIIRKDLIIRTKIVECRIYFFKCLSLTSWFIIWPIIASFSVQFSLCWPIPFLSQLWWASRLFFNEDDPKGNSWCCTVIFSASRQQHPWFHKTGKRCFGFYLFFKAPTLFFTFQFSICEMMKMGKVFIEK